MPRGMKRGIYWEKKQVQTLIWQEGEPCEKKGYPGLVLKLFRRKRNGNKLLTPQEPRSQLVQKIKTLVSVAAVAR